LDPENPSENLPEEPPEGSTDRYKRKLRRLIDTVSKQRKSDPKAILNTIKQWINTAKVRSRRLSGALSKRSKSMLSGLKTALKSALDSIKHLLRKLSETKNSLNKWLDAKKDKLRRMKRELIIWVISVAVISLVAAITNYIMNKQQVASQRIFQLERQLETTIKEKKEAENKLKEMASLRERLGNLFEEKQLRTAIKEKRAIENKLKDTVTQLEKTVGQLEQMGRLEEHLANNVEEITRLRENLSKLEQERASVESLARLASTWLESEAQMQEAEAAIETKRLVEKKLKDTAGQLEKTAQQLKGVGQLKEQFANNLEEITRLRKDLAEQLESQRSINELLGWEKPEAAIPAAKKTTVENTREVDSALEIPQGSRFSKKSTLAIVFTIAVVCVSLLCLFGSRVQALRKLFKKRLSEDQLHKFERLEDISFTLLGGFLLEGFVKMGYEVTLTSGITSGRLTCVLERENEKALFRYIICKEEDFGREYVEDFANSMEAEKADKGYLVTTGAVAEPVLAFAKEKSIELAGKEKLVELIPSCLLEEGLMKRIEDTTAKLIEQGMIAKNEMAEKEALSEKLKESEDMITELNDEKTVLSEYLETMKKELNRLSMEHEDHEEEIQGHRKEISNLSAEKDRLQEKAQYLDEQSAKYKELEEQLSEKYGLLKDERNQRQQLEEKLRQSDKDMEEAMHLTDDLEEKLAKKEQELSEKEEALKELSAQGDFKGAVNKEEFEELKANLKTLQQSLIEKEKTITTLKELQADLKKKLSSKVGLITELQQQLSLAGEKEQEVYSTVIAKLKEQLAEKEQALSETGEKKAALATELKARKELLDKLREENQQLSAKKDRYIKKVVTKLQNEVRSYVAEMEEAFWPSLDLRPLADKGVLLKLEPKGPVVTLKNIAAGSVSFESQRKLDIPSSCNITLIFFGSSNPLTVRGSLIWQKKFPGSSMYNIRFRFLSLKPGQSRRINEYLNKTRKALNKVKK